MFGCMYTSSSLTVRKHRIIQYAYTVEWSVSYFQSAARLRNCQAYSGGHSCSIPPRSENMRRFAFLLAISLSGIFGLAEAIKSSTNRGQPIIIDTDLFSDVDDVGALTIANVLHNCGLADLRGVVINSPSHYGALGASVRIRLY